MIFDVATRKVRHFADIDNGVFSLAFSANGKWLASAHANGKVTLWERNSAQVLSKVAHVQKTFELGLGALFVAFSPDSRSLASGGVDGTAKLWDVTATGLNPHETLRGQFGWVGVSYSPDGRRVVSCGSDGNLKLWDTDSGLEVATLYGTPAVFAFSPDGNTLYSASRTGEVRAHRAPPLGRLENQNHN
jgi:WD40 repeat protein